MSDKVTIAKKIISTSETLYFNSQASNHLLDQKLVIVTSSTSHEPLALPKTYNSYIINYFILASSKIFFLSTTPSGIHPYIYIFVILHQIKYLKMFSKTCIETFHKIVV